MTFEFDFGTCIGEAIERFGETSTFRRYLIGAKTSARNRILKLKERKNIDGLFLNEEEIRVKMASWTPKTPESYTHEFSLSALRREFNSAPPEKQAEIREALKRMMEEK